MTVTTEQATKAGTRQFATFRVADLVFGVDVKSVQEVIRFQEMTPVPLSAPAIRGLINLRGQIIVAIDLRNRLDLPPLEEGAQPMNVVVHHNDEVVSLLVDSIGDVIEVRTQQREETPGGIGIPDRLISGVFKLDEMLMLELNVERAIDLK